MSEVTPLKRAFIALEETRAELKAAQDAAREPIAIIGMGCRIPGDGDDAMSFWRILEHGVDAIGPLPSARWDVEGLYHPDPEHVGTIATRGGGFLRNVTDFDPAFFGITRREAQGMDPQQRLFLEVCWEALENAGQPPDRLAGSRTGVYVGLCGNDYAQLQLETRDRALLDAHFSSGIAHSIASGRLSYLLGLQGPSLTIDTACSSSLVAIHLACQALRSNDCRMVLAGGANLILSPDLYIALSHSRMLSPDGRCRTFDAAADGFARGEGSGVVVLKRLRDAQADGDRILAVILGSAVNQDGASSGLTAPNGPAQEAVVQEALARSAVEPRLVSYIEAHGTGTQLGDPLELRALGAVFAPDRPADRPLSVGSVKTNVGHLEAAAGVTGLIKVVLSLQHEQIPAHLHHQNPTPHIAWQELRLHVPTALTPWQPIEGRRIAGVSSFGFSGTNAHIVLEQAPAKATPRAPRVARRYSFVLSAFDAPSLRAHAKRHAALLASFTDAQLPDVCFTAAVARAHHPERAVISAATISELREGLLGLAAGADAAGLRKARVTNREPLRVAFLFTGQGAQYAGMGRQLYDEQPIFRAALDRCAAVLDAELSLPLLSVLYPAAHAPVEGAPALLDQTQYTQPALFALEYALTCLWQAWGITPSVVIGHSVGEYVAACFAGVLKVEDALRLLAARGRLMQSLPGGGAMAAVFAPESEVTPALGAYAHAVSVAAVNGPTQTVISGTATDVDAICAVFEARGVRCQRLKVSHAFHSPLVEPILSAFEEKARSVHFSPPKLRLISNVTGALADARVVTQPSYWREHVRFAVRFGDGLRAVAALRPDVCLEVGPHPTLLAFAQEVFDGPSALLLPSLSRALPDRERLDESLGALYLAGAPIDWRAVWAGVAAEIVDLPSYAFQRERCWFAARRVVAPRGRDTGHPLLGVRLHSALSDIVQFEGELQAESVPFLRDHRVNGRLILPAAAFVDMALSAGQRAFSAVQQLEDLVIGEPLVVGEEETRRVQTVVRRREDGAASFEILSAATDRDEPEWRTHARGSLRALQGSAPGATLAPLSGAAHVTRAAHQAALAARGLAFGPTLQGVEGLEFVSGEARGTIALPAEAAQDAERYLLPPALLDACLQILAAAIPEGAATGAAYLPLVLDSVRVYRSPGRTVTSRALVAKPAQIPAETLTGEVCIYDQQGVLAELRGITLRASSTASSASASSDLYTITWEQTAPDAAWTPTPSTLAAQLSATLPGLAREHALDSYQQGFVALEALSTSWIARALHDLGWRALPGETVNVAALANELGVIPRFQRLLGRLLEVLEEDGVLRAGADGFAVIRALPSQDATAQVSSVLAQHGSSRARIELTRRCGEQLAFILRGSVDPLQLLFPDGSTELATALYRDTPEARVYNQLIRDTVRAFATRVPAGRSLRVLEVGGGTGGTTAWVAPALDAARTEYLFTDLGPSLVNEARTRFAAFPFMQFAVLDLERPSLEGRQFDLILASNVVHATPDLLTALAALHGLLAPGGTLLMLEVAGRERWIDITFGLTVGWWHFTDSELRGGYPLLSRAKWRELLSSAGFESSEIGAEHPHSREALLAARKPLAPRPAPGKVRPWLIFGDESGVGTTLAAQLEQLGHRAVVFSRGLEDVDSDAAIAQAIAENALDCAGIVHLWSLDLPALPAADAESLLVAQRISLGSLLAILRALGRLSFTTDVAPRLWIGTRGALSLGAAPLALEQAPVLGLALGIAREHPELHATRIDLDPLASTKAQAESLLTLLARPAAEEAYAARGGALFVPRITPLEPPPKAESGVARLARSASGVLEELSVSFGAHQKIGANQVEIQVHAAGLNFRDVMNAVALRDDPEPLGGECAGRIVAVGAAVIGLTVGEDVVAIAEGCFASFAVAEAGNVVPLSRQVSFAEAASVPFAFMTALFALRDCAGLKHGETVLIHAAAGGVGQAAVQLARRAGATIIATAGNETKRAFLREQGIAHVLDSRSLAFQGEVLALTGGRGVDAVLNSLAGDVISASVACLADTGRFLEIGKRDIWSSEQFAAVRPKGHYFAIDLAALREREPARSAALFREVIADLSSGKIGALAVRAFPLRSAASAFRFMAQARHIGKVVIVPEEAQREALDRLSPNASYLVTGGLAGLGLLSAERLVARGARYLALVGRRAPDARAQQTIERLRSSGVVVQVIAEDIGSASGVARVFQAMDAALPSLRGIIHSAGALEDGALLQQSWARFLVPLHAKVVGAWALHVLSAQRRLDFFVLYSSVASVLGSSGQANHSAANAFLDALAGQRRALGLPALSISWGAWSEIGAAADRGVGARVGALGMGVISPTHGLELLDNATHSDAAHVAALPVVWSRFLEQRGPNGRALFARVAEQRVAAGAPSVTVQPPPAGALDLEALDDASAAQRYAVLLAFVSEHVARVIGVPRGTVIAADQPLNELGLDSLMAVDLRNRLSRGLGQARSLPATIVFDHPTLDALARHLAIILTPARPDEVVLAPAIPRDALGAIDTLSDEQIDALFAKRIGTN